MQHPLPGRPTVLLVLALITICLVRTAHGQDLDVMTYNIRVAYGDPGINNWENRKHHVADLIGYYRPDIFGVQEALLRQNTWLEKRLPQYDYVGVGRDDGEQEGEYSAIFYDTSALTPLKTGTFWLSRTPGKPSFGWGAKHRRICTYALFMENGSNRTFWVFNTHFDHQVAVAREHSAKLILDSIRVLTHDLRAPVILMGDFNATEDMPPIIAITQVLRDARQHAQSKPYGPTGTYNAFQFDKAVTRRIDYIFVSPDILVRTYRAIDDFAELRYPADHLPLLVTLHLP